MYLQYPFKITCIFRILRSLHNHNFESSCQLTERFLAKFPSTANISSHLQILCTGQSELSIQLETVLPYIWRCGWLSLHCKAGPDLEYNWDSHDYQVNSRQDCDHQKCLPNYHVGFTKFLKASTLAGHDSFQIMNLLSFLPNFRYKKPAVEW